MTPRLPQADKCEGVDPTMGRGRAKAKQTKVARELKYRLTGTDFASLEREMRGSEHAHDTSNSGEIPDAYADLAEEYDDYDGEPVDEPTLRKSG